MGKERKICLPAYKIAYSICFILILSLIRGIAYETEIGGALEPPLALLAAVFCADTYVQEILSKRSEIQRLCPLKKRTEAILRRLFLQELYLLVLSAAGYGMMLLFQSPIAHQALEKNGKYDLRLFGVCLGAAAVTLIFWGIFSHTISCLCRNMWAGMGISLLLWIFCNSMEGDRLLGNWNLFSYSFRDIENPGDLGWLKGKLLAILLSGLLGVLLPKIIKERG